MSLTIIDENFIFEMYKHINYVNIYSTYYSTFVFKILKLNVIATFLCRLIELMKYYND